MPFQDDPEEMTPEQRLGEVAAILAAGWLRCPFTEKPLDCSASGTPVTGTVPLARVPKGGGKRKSLPPRARVKLPDDLRVKLEEQLRRIEESPRAVRGRGEGTGG